MNVVEGFFYDRLYPLNIVNIRPLAVYYRFKGTRRAGCKNRIVVKPGREIPPPEPANVTSILPGEQELIRASLAADLDKSMDSIYVLLTGPGRAADCLADRPRTARKKGEEWGAPTPLHLVTDTGAA
jgi:hypothetical protein